MYKIILLLHEYKAVIYGRLRTNKFPEGHSHALQLTAGCSHPGIELLVEIPNSLQHRRRVGYSANFIRDGTGIPSKEKIRQFRFKILPNVTITVT